MTLWQNRSYRLLFSATAVSNLGDGVSALGSMRLAGLALLFLVATGALLVLDLRKEDEIYAGNRFVPYAVFPDCNISIHVMWGKQQQNVVFACGKSILDRSSKTNVGDLMLKHGGGGHVAAGTCQVATDKADEVLKDLIENITADG